MSRITDFRQRVIDTITTSLPKVEEVEWYDGIFDEDDIETWSNRTPLCVVAVRRAPTTDISTGESSVDLQVLVTVVCQGDPLDSDILCWDILEDLADLAKNSTFGDVNAGPANAIKFERLRDAGLRREGVCVGVCEWMQGLTIGRKRFEERIAVLDPDGKPIKRLPPKLNIEATVTDVAGRRSPVDSYHFLDED